LTSADDDEPDGAGPRTGAGHGSGQDDAPGTPRADHRLGPTVTVLISMAALLLAPARLVPGPRWLLPAVEGLLVIALLAIDPGRIDHRSRQVRALSLALVAALTAGTAFGTGRLVLDLVHGDPQTDDPAQLLVAGALVWVETIIAFGFVYWEVDGGGPAERYRAPSAHPQLAFPQHLSPEVAPPGWRPVFSDYLYLALTNNIALSPTDVMPLARWAKAVMGLQSVISLVILSLVVANSVNLLS
jgi:uncharacterized membrane protein